MIRSVSGMQGWRSLEGILPEFFIQSWAAVLKEGPGLSDCLHPSRVDFGQDYPFAGAARLHNEITVRVGAKALSIEGKLVQAYHPVHPKDKTPVADRVGHDGPLPLGVGRLDRGGHRRKDPLGSHQGK